MDDAPSARIQDRTRVLGFAHARYALGAPGIFGGPGFASATP
jgi:hypothetical protein